MCGRYTIFQNSNLGKRYKIKEDDLDELLSQLKDRYNAAPGQNLPVITNKSGNHLSTMRWGLVPVWAKDEKIGYRMINARAESVFEKPTWKRPVLRQRCLVPSTGFYEWKATDDGKQPYFIYPKDQQLFSFAGIYDTWTNKSTGEILESFSIITTSPNAEMESIHDRMPVILKPSDEARWLEPSNDQPESVADLLRPYDDNMLLMHPVTKDVGNARNDEKRLIDVLS